MMRTFYHLSPEDSLERIVPSSSGRTASSITPRLPVDCHGEDQTVKRVCIAPTIWQCIPAIPRDGRLFIYKLTPTSVTEPIGGTADLEWSDEQWITDEDVQAAGGEIGLTLVGFIDKTGRLSLTLKIKGRTNELPRDALKESTIWNVTEQQYVLRPELMVK